MSKVTVGLKVGSTSLKFVEILHGKDKFRLKNLGMVNFPFSEKQEGYLNQTSFLAQKIREVIHTHNLNPRRIVTGVEGESVVVRIIRVQNMKDSELREAIRWEAEEHLPYPIEDVSLGYHILKKNLVSSQGREMNVLLAGVKKQTIDDHLQIFQQAGLSPAIVDIDSLALYNVLENGNIGTIDGTAILNIGHYTTNLLVLAEDYPFLVRDIKFGGDNITRSLMQALEVTYVEAENIKKAQSLAEISKQLTRQTEVEQIEQVIRGSLGELVKEIVRSFEYFISNREGSLVKKVIMSGGNCLIEHIDNFLSQELEVPV